MPGRRQAFNFNKVTLDDRLTWRDPGAGHVSWPGSPKATCAALKADQPRGDLAPCHWIRGVVIQLERSE
jgi:hypothetical protein